MCAFDPQFWGYKASEVQPFDKGWIIAPLNLPVIACGDDNLWYCPIEAIYDQELHPTAKALIA